MKIPLLTICDALVAGSGIEAMVRALSLNATKRNVLLVTSDTCLYGRMARSGDFRTPRDMDAAFSTLLFPPEVYETEGFLHPDRLKRHGERLIERRGIQLLYACELLGMWDRIAVLAHKSGIYGVRCTEVYDCREEVSLLQPAYCLHTMLAGIHHVLYKTTTFAGEDSRSQWNHYEQALEWLPKGATLARGGTEPTERDGFSFAQAYYAGISRSPQTSTYVVGNRVPQSLNPLHEIFPVQEVIAPDCDVERYDVTVVGGGTAGAVAAYHSARQGFRTVLLEMNEQLGGTATVGGVSTYWFGLRTGATEQVDQAVNAYYKRLGLVRSSCMWSNDDVFQPDIKAHALLGMCLQAGVEVRFGCIACGVQAEDSRVTGVFYAAKGSLHLAECTMTLDCTGDGDICMFAGAAHSYGDEKNGMTYWGSLAQYTTPESYRNNFSTMVHVGDPLDYTRFIVESRRQGTNLYDHGRYVAVRESRHIKGLSTLTLNNIVAMEPTNDMLYTCFSNYDPKGRLTADMVCFGLLPPNMRVAVPRGTVIPVDDKGKPIAGLLIGGKAISCTHEAFPGIRMQPDLQRQGLALAVLATCAIRQGVEAWKAADVSKEILKAGGDMESPPQNNLPPLHDVIYGLTGDEPWEWLEAAPESFVTETPPIVRVMMARQEEVLPLLRKMLKCTKKAKARLTISRLLLWHGDESGAQTVMEAVAEMLDACEGLPQRFGSIRYGQLLPDHGLMPEMVYLLNSLSKVPYVPVVPLLDRVLRRLEADPRDWRDLRSGIYCYCECFAYVAQVRGDLAMLPLLWRVLALPELNREQEDPLLQERFHILRISILSVLDILGDQKGTQGLREYLQDHSRPLVLAARMLITHRKITQD